MEDNNEQILYTFHITRTLHDNTAYIALHYYTTYYTIMTDKPMVANKIVYVIG